MEIKPSTDQGKIRLMASKLEVEKMEDLPNCVVVILDDTGKAMQLIKADDPLKFVGILEALKLELMTS